MSTWKIGRRSKVEGRRSASACEFDFRQISDLGRRPLLCRMSAAHSPVAAAGPFSSTFRSEQALVYAMCCVRHRNDPAADDVSWDSCRSKAGRLTTFQLESQHERMNLRAHLTNPRDGCEAGEHVRPGDLQGEPALRDRGLLAPPPPEDEAQDDRHDQRGHQRKMEAEAFTLDREIPRQAPPRQP